MRLRLFKENIYHLPAILWVLSALMMTGCRQDNYLEVGYDDTGLQPLLQFRGEITDGMPFETRALTQDPVNIEPSEFDGYFYAEINDPTYQPEGATEPRDASKFGYYRVPLGGSGGVLEYAGENMAEKPNWYTVDDDHYFWSWTLPWTEAALYNGITIETWQPTDDPSGISRAKTRDGEEENEAEGEGDGEGDGEGEDNPTLPPLSDVNPGQYLNTNPIRIKLQNTRAEDFRYVNTTEEKDSSWAYGSWGNGYFFEKFIGAKSGPYDFRRNGVEVPLQFRHLMSKISLRSLLFYTASGTTKEDMKANITFINMPTEFTFYPHPTEDGIPNTSTEYMKKNGPPIVVTNQESADPNGGIMFGFTNPIDLLPEEDPDNKVEYRDKFYICPEVDFSKVSFKVELLDETYMKRGEYYGDFSSVAFDRDTASDYDNIEDDNGFKIDDSTVLHAGETMYFDLIVREYGGGGYTIYVRGWNPRPIQGAKHYPHPGIYVDGQATELISTTITNEEKYERYGDGFLDGEKNPPTPSLPYHLGVYHLYSDLDMGNRTAFPLDKEYVMNGMGYILKFSPTNGDTTKVTIGKMFDIYIEINGHTVYIDSNGNICTYNESTGKYEPNGQQIDMNSEKSSFTLDVATGMLS
ncbi:MAG: hypothetical protein J1D77_02250 [Muribaculaceae bacterium]|nr:hypothetical protein [Muribaculaceae bacterium]